MNILIPMAGRGSRFKESGYTDSKPFIDVNGKPMIQRVIENLNIEFDSNYEFVIICLQEDYDRYDFSIFDDIIGHEEWKVICLPDVTEGAAQTILEASGYIDNNIPLLTLNSDQMIDYNPEETFKRFEKFDGGIPCFYGKGPDWSYAKIDDDGLVTKVAEKVQISNDATAGYYYWKRGSDFVKYAEQMIEHNDRSNGEFYVAPVYNWAIEDGKKFKISYVDKVYELGTPEYLENYLHFEKEKKSSKKYKVAVCISGESRYFDVSSKLFEHWNKLYDDVEFDFFMSVWDSKNRTFGKNPDYSKYKFLTKYEILEYNEIPEYVRNEHKESSALFYAYALYRVHKLRRSLAKSCTKVTKIEMNKVVETLPKYDCVIQTRPDIIVPKVLLNYIRESMGHDHKEMFSPYMFYTSQGSSPTNSSMNELAMADDNFSFAHPSAMDKFSYFFHDSFILGRNIPHLHTGVAMQLQNNNIYNFSFSQSKKPGVFRGEEGEGQWRQKDNFPTPEWTSDMINKKGGVSFLFDATDSVKKYRDFRTKYWVWDNK